MARKTTKAGVGAETRRKLIETGEKIIRADGLGKLSTRTLSEMSGTTLGTSFYHFKSRDSLIYEINEKTLRNMETFMFRAVEKEKNKTAKQRLLRLANAYFEFAVANRNLWLALFQFVPAPSTEIPESYQILRARMIERIITLFDDTIDIPQAGPVALARTLYEATHGIVSLGLNNTLGGTHDDVRERLGIMMSFIREKH